MGPPEGDSQPPPAHEASAGWTAPSTTPESPARVGIPNPGPSFRGVMKSRDFSLLWVGQFGSEVGNGLVQLALPFLVLEITGSAFQLAGAYVFQFMPWLLFGLLGGVLVDRWDRRMTIVIVEAVRAAAFLGVGTAFALDSSVLSVEIIYGLIFLESTLQNFFNPARLALMPNLVKQEDLRAANSLMEVSRHIGFLIAPSAGLILADLLGSSTIILADGVTFLVSGVTVFFIKWRQPPRELVQVDGWQKQLGQVINETVQGINVIRAVRLLQVTMLLGFSLNIVVAPIQTLLPLFVLEVKDQTQAYFGLLAAAFMVGLIPGSLGAPFVATKLGLGRMTVTSVFVLGSTIAVAAYLPTVWVPVAALAIAGIAIGSLNVAQINMLQTSTTDEERGRVSAAYYSATLGVRSIGYFVAGALVAPIGVQPLFVVFGLVVIGVGAYIWRIPEVREHH